MKGYRVIGEERLKRKRKWNIVYVGGLMETKDKCFEEIKQIVESDLKGMNVCEVRAFFVGGNAIWSNDERTVTYAVHIVNDDGSISDMIPLNF